MLFAVTSDLSRLFGGLVILFLGLRVHLVKRREEGIRRRLCLCGLWRRCRGSVGSWLLNGWLVCRGDYLLFFACIGSGRGGACGLLLHRELAKRLVLDGGDELVLA